MKDRLKQKMNWVYLIMMLLAMLTVVAQPEGPGTIDIVDTQRRTPAASAAIPAVAGNVTELNIFAETVTRSWQGYYGNVSGSLTLDDADNNTFYNWSVASPRGEIYASEAIVDFTYGNVRCYNYTYDNPSDPTYVNLTDYESTYGMQAEDADGINETFTTGLSYDSFYVASYEVNEVCPVTYLYDNTGKGDPTKFQEVLLYDNTSDKLVYTSILEQNVAGFNDREWDFEMLVGEDGNDGDTAATLYYFYVELE